MSIPNKLFISGPEDVLQTIQETHFKNGSLDFSTIIPAPQELLDEEEKEDDLLFIYMFSESYFVLEPYFPGIEGCEDFDEVLAFLDKTGNADFKARLLRKSYLQETYGTFSLGTWKIYNWGTSENAFNGAIEDSRWYPNNPGTKSLLAGFMTEDGGAVQVISALSALYPEVFLGHYYLHGNGMTVFESVYEGGLEISSRKFIKSAMENMRSQGIISLPESGIDWSF